MEQRQCEECRQVLPLTTKNFAHPPGITTGFQFVCRKCKRSKTRKAKLAKIETKAIDTFTNRVVSGGSNIPHTAELLEGIMQYFGGANGFASLVMKQYFESPPGGRIRNSILEMVVRLASKNTEQGGAKKPIDLYSEEELEQEINQRLEQAVLTYGGKRYLNAPSEPTSVFDSPLAVDPVGVGIPAGGTEDPASRIEREAHRSLEALQANSQADGVSPVPVERDPGDRGQSVGEESLHLH
jgi:hypothetical protein